MNNKKNKHLTKATSLVLTGVTLIPVVTAPVTVLADSIDKFPNSKKTSQVQTISNKYSFIAKYLEGKTQVEAFGDGWYETTKSADDADQNSFTVENPSDDKKGHIGVLYKNVGNYKGQTVNLRVTVKDWNKYLNNDTAKISIERKNIAVNIIGYSDVLLDWEYVDDAGNPIQMDGAYISFADIDASQRIGFDKNTASNLKEVIYDDGSILEYENQNGTEWIKASSDNKNYNDDDKRTMVTALYEGNKLTFHWGVDPSKRNNKRVVPHDRGGVEHLVYTARKLAPTETLNPTKKVNDADEPNVENNTLATKGEDYSYDIYHTVPDEFKDYYYKSYKIEDTLPECLNIKQDSIKVFDEADNDVTGNFDIKVEGQKVIAIAKNVGDAGFYNHTYKLHIETKVKQDSDLTGFIKDGKIQIPNTATVTINDKDSKDSNTTTTTVVEPIEKSVNKKLVENGQEIDHEDLTVDNNIATYKLENIVPNDKDIESLEISDDLEDVMNLEQPENIRVYMSDAQSNKESKEKHTKNGRSGESQQELDSVKVDGEDVTAEGDFSIEGNKVVWKAKDPNKFKGKKLTMVLQAKLKDSLDYSSLAQYIKDGKIEIPNTSKLIIDGEETESNTVTVSTPMPEKIEAKVEKTLVDDGKEVDHEDLTVDNNIATYKLKNIIPNDKDIESLEIIDDLEDVINLVNKDSITVFAKDVENSEKSDSTNTSEVTSTTKENTKVQSSPQVKAKMKANNDDLINKVNEIRSSLDKSEDKTDKVILSQCDMVLRTLESGESKDINKNIQIIKEALNSGVGEKATEQQKEYMQTLIDILSSQENGSSNSDLQSTNKQEESTDVSNNKSEASDSEEANKELDSVKVDGEDVTKDFDIEVVDGNKVVLKAKDPNKFKGKELVVLLQGKIKDGADLSSYEKDGKIEIPNTSKLIVNGEEITSNEVNVTPETPKTPEKPINSKPITTSKEVTSTVIPDVSNASETPKTPEKPNVPEDPAKEDPAKPLAATGVKIAKNVGIIGLIVGAIAGIGYFLTRKKDHKNK